MKISNQTYSIEEMIQAFWEVFYESGDWFFDYSGTEEHKNRNIEYDCRTRCHSSLGLQTKI